MRFLGPMLNKESKLNPNGSDLASYIPARRWGVPKSRKSSAKGARPRNNRHWVAEIVPAPSNPKEFPKSTGNDAIEIDKWLKLVDSYWQRSSLRKPA